MLRSDKASPGVVHQDAREPGAVRRESTRPARLGFRVCGLRDHGFGFGVRGLGLGVQGCGAGFVFGSSKRTILFQQSLPKHSYRTHSKPP